MNNLEALLRAFGNSTPYKSADAMNKQAGDKKQPVSSHQHQLAQAKAKRKRKIDKLNRKNARKGKIKHKRRK